MTPIAYIIAYPGKDSLGGGFRSVFDLPPSATENLISAFLISSQIVFGKKLEANQVSSSSLDPNITI